MPPQFAAREWPYITVIVLMALTLIGLLHAFFTMVVHNGECGAGLVEGITDISEVQACFRRYLGETGEWLNARFAMIAAAVGPLTARALMIGHHTMRTDVRHATISKRMYAYRSAAYWLIAMLCMIGVFITFVYTDWYRR